MGWYTPRDTGRLTWRPDNDPTAGRGSSTLEELDAALPGARALAEAAEPYDTTAFDRETVARMTAQHVAGGASPEWARANAIGAARRHESGDYQIPYPDAAPRGTITQNTTATSGQGGR